MRQPGTAPLALVAALAVLVVLPASAAAATPFGANLEAAQPDASFTCAGPLPPFGMAFGTPTCTALTAGRFGDGAGSHLVPSGFGVITRVDVRMPNATGPMRITVMRANRSALSTVAACCYHVAESEPFTPAAGQTSSIPMRLPVKSELTPTNVFEYDAIGISALSPQTPVPAAAAPGIASGGYFPAVTAGQERFEGQATLGEIQVMLRGIWEPDADRDGLGDETQDGCVGATRRGIARAAQCAPGGGGPGAGGPAPGGPGGPAGGGPGDAPAGGTSTGTLIQPTATVRRGRSAVRLTCGDAGCAGMLRLQNRPAGQAGARRTFGARRVSIPARATRAVRVRLNRAGRALLRGDGTAAVWANLGGTGALSRRITLSRP